MWFEIFDIEGRMVIYDLYLNVCFKVNWVFVCLRMMCLLKVLCILDWFWIFIKGYGFYFYFGKKLFEMLIF